MNKSAFFAELNRSLSTLSAQEREDILRDMEEHFYEGQKRGLSEEEIIEKLGSPKKISDTFIAETKLKRISKAETIPQKVSAGFGAMAAILVLAPISFLFMLIPVFLIGVFLLGLWQVSLFLLLSLPVAVIILLIMMFGVGFKLFALLSILFFGIGWVSMAMAIFLGACLITALLAKGIINLFQWNINFIKKQMRG